MHLVLRSGYHDHDRDLTQLSIRRLAREVGLTVGAVRHALAQLLKYQMVVRQGPMLQVRKFVTEQPISKRARNKREEKQEAQRQERLEDHARQVAKRKEADQQRAAQGRPPAQRRRRAKAHATGFLGGRFILRF